MREERKVKRERHPTRAIGYHAHGLLTIVGSLGGLCVSFDDGYHTTYQDGAFFPSVRGGRQKSTRAER